MESKLFNYYSIDECVNEKKLYKELDAYVEEGSLEYKLDRDVIRIMDLDLSETQIDKIVKLFDSLEVYPYMDYEDGEDDAPFFESDEYEE